MISKKFALGATALVLVSAFAVNANAASYVFNFTGECDDCAFDGDPSADDFDPMNDGLTQTVTATLVLPNVEVTADGLEYLGGPGSPLFSYHGSSLINPFSISDPYLFTVGLLPSGEVRDGETFVMASSQNYTDPANPQSYYFPNFCTSLGEEVLSLPQCGVGLVSFSLASNGDWSIFGVGPSDVGSDGGFSPASAVPVPAAVWLFGSGIVGLMGFARRWKSA